MGVRCNVRWCMINICLIIHDGVITVGWVTLIRGKYWEKKSASNWRFIGIEQFDCGARKESCMTVLQAFYVILSWWMVFIHCISWMLDWRNSVASQEAGSKLTKQAVLTRVVLSLNDILLGKLRAENPYNSLWAVLSEGFDLGLVFNLKMVSFFCKHILRSRFSHTGFSCYCSCWSYLCYDRSWSWVGFGHRICK